MLKFDDIIGQEDIKDYLKRTITGNKVPHALMFNALVGNVIPVRCQLRQTIRI